LSPVLFDAPGAEAYALNEVPHASSTALRDRCLERLRRGCSRRSNDDADFVRDEQDTTKSITLTGCVARDAADETHFTLADFTSGGRRTA
jgi:hypothetical protein